MTELPRTKELELDIASAMRRDRFALTKTLQRLQRRKRDGKPIDREWSRFEERLNESRERVVQRRARVPTIDYPSDLPIAAKVDDIRTAVDEHQVVIVCGETGSGKSTQLPKLLLQMGLADDGFIGHTQPRRLAARSIATRLASELSTSVGQAVGFKIRFTDETKPLTYIKLMTDGILLAETQGDRYFESYNAIIIDEAHERSLNIDFLLGYIKRLLPRRPDLKLIITSATLDAERFQRHFASEDSPVPIIEVSGRGYPVETLYRPWSEEDDETGERDPHEAIADALDEIAEREPGDGLIFLPTEQEIRAAAKHLRGHVVRQSRLANTEILPLYARLPTHEQNRVFESHPHRRIVLATNVAESSLTVPGVRFVIDTGTARIARYSPRSKVQRLPIESISRASADQRAGRCGRVGPGICIRLYSEEDFHSRDAFTTPEIQRTNLASVILAAKSLKLGPIDEFPFVDPPRPEAIKDGYRTLFELGAIDDRRELTDLGRRLARLPVDPRVGRMILAADGEGCLADVLIIASGLEVQDPRDRPPERKEKADEAHQQFKHEDSDFLGLLKLWDFFHKLREELSQNRLRKACKQNFVSYQRMRQWLDIHRQLLRLAKDAGLRPGPRNGDEDAIHRALLTGLLSGVATKSDRHEYLGAGGVKFFLWPGSSVFKAKPQWIMSAEIVETSQRYGRMVARINPKWIEPLALHVVKRSYSDPHWHRKTERCVAFEKVTLFGIPIVARRRVGYASIDPVLARQMLIDEGLVQGQYEGNEEFLVHNRLLLEELEALRDQTRRREFIIDTGVLVEFYEQRLPADVVDGRALQTAIKQDGKALNALLTMSREDLLEVDDVSMPGGDAFPKQLEVGGMTLNLDYRFEPGAEDDGVTLVVPAAGIPQVDARRLEWLVPGLLEERVVALIRSLPKRIRRNLTPAPETARRVVGEIEFGRGDFVASVAEALGGVAGEKIPVEEFRLDRLNHHLQFNVRVVDEQGETVAEGRDFPSIRGELSGGSQESTGQLEDEQWTRSGMTDWSFDTLPDQVVVRRGGHDIPCFPALFDEGDSVGLRLLNSRAASQHSTPRGLMRLLALQSRKALRSQVNWLPEMESMRLWAASRIGTQQLNEEVSDLIALRAIENQPRLPNTRDEWLALLANKIEHISVATQDVATCLPRLLQRYHEAQVAFEGMNKNRYASAAGDIKQQINALIHPGFMTSTPWEWLQQMPRYFQAIQMRIERLGQLGAKEDHYRGEIQEFWERRQQHLATGNATTEIDPTLVEFRWMIEEFRVSLYAQTLGTYVSVSATRLEKQWSKVLRSPLP